MISQYAERVAKSREPGKVIRRRVSRRKHLARWAFCAVILAALTVAGGLYYALSVLAVAAVGGWMDALG